VKESADCRWDGRRIGLICAAGGGGVDLVANSTEDKLEYTDPGVVALGIGSVYGALSGQGLRDDVVGETIRGDARGGTIGSCRYESMDEWLECIGGPLGVVGR